MVKFNEETRQRIYKLISQGYRNADVCAVCDIAESTFYTWIERGRKAKSGKYKEFVHEYEKARALRKNRLLQELLDTGRNKEDWKAIAWVLERSYDDEFARPEVKIRQQVESKSEIEHKVPFSDLERIVIESGKKSDEEKKKE